MTDSRGKIQLARIQDDAWLWSTLVRQLMADDFNEGMKAALSGATRGGPGSEIKADAVRLIVAHLDQAAQVDLKNAMDAAVTAAIYSAPDSEDRAAATAFIVANLEPLAAIDSDLAANNSQFALGWARPDSDVGREAARMWGRLSVNRPEQEAESGYCEHDILGQDDMAATAKHA